MSSPLKAWFILATTSVIFMIAGHSLGGRSGLLWALVLSLGINSLVYLYFDKRIIGYFPGRLLEGRDPWGVLNHLEDLAARAKIYPPKVLVTNSPSPQSLTIGRSQNQALIVLTNGLLEKLSSQELKAVLAYNVATIKHQETTLYLVAGTFCSVLLKLAKVGDQLVHIVLGSKRDLFVYLLAPLCYLILKSCIKKDSYFAADQLASNILDDPQLLANTLWKLQSYSAHLPSNSPPAYAHAFIVNPLTNKGWSRYFQAQPNVKSRIQKLIGYYPI